MDQQTQLIIEQQLRRNEVAFTQYQAAREKEVLGKPVAKPSFLKYGLLMYVIFACDIAFAVLELAELTGIGAIILRICKFAFGVGFFLLSWYLGRSIKNVRSIRESRMQAVQNIEVTIQKYRQAIAQGMQLLRKSQMGRTLLRSIRKSALGKSLQSFRKATRSPVIKSLLASGAELVWVLDIVPWYTISMYLTYRDHRAEYREAQIARMAYQEAAAQERIQFQNFQEVTRQRLLEELSKNQVTHGSTMWLAA